MRTFLLLLLWLFGATVCIAQRGPLPGFSTDTPYLIYYGNWTDTQAEFARDHYHMVILHPSVSNVTPAQIATIQSGPDRTAATKDDVPVLAYISVGEDDRPGAPATGDGTGPKVDPRNSHSDPLAGISPLGAPSPGGTGFASYYLDDGVLSDPNSIADDGQPDRNRTFGGYYVNAGDPAWLEVLKVMTKSATGRAGLEELLTSTAGNGYHCDGLLLDTLDTPAPNSYGVTQYEWTAPGLQSLVAGISAAFPDKIMLGNRGLFFYNPNLKHYEFTLRPYLNLILYESYYTDSSASAAPTAFFDDNRYNFAPKINAESQRGDGFTVLALGYTTPGEPAHLSAEDFLESQGKQGWSLYRTNPALNTTPFNTTAIAWNHENPDVLEPLWDSSAATNSTPPAPRVGIQEVEAGNRQVTVRWDVARDQTGPVRYNIYYSDQEDFDFTSAIKLAAITPTTPDNYLRGTGAGRFPFEFTVTGLTNGLTHYFAVRAEDALGTEDTNPTILEATPQGPVSNYLKVTVDGDKTEWNTVPISLLDPAGDGTQDIISVRLANDTDHLYLLVEYGALTGVNTFNGSPSTFLSLDTDLDTGTGFDIYGLGVIGADIGWQNDFPFSQSSGTFNTNGTFTGGGAMISPFNTTAGFQEYAIKRTATYRINASPPLNVFTQDSVRVAFWTDGAHPEFSGVAEYQFAPDPGEEIYANWKRSHFNPAQLSDPLISGDGADPDRDDLPVFMEFALGLNPLTPDNSALTSTNLVTEDDGQHLAITFTRRPPDSGLTYSVESSSDLRTWNGNPVQFVEFSTKPLQPGLEKVTIRLSATLTDSPGFLRLRITLD
ncbi:MAG: fibronectin type III domain-containing protein [Verrucomicrobiaceae bacterium]|nr:fibronectin type III domain-containing protein [Verrucomicrobiaceae bacterium]